MDDSLNNKDEVNVLSLDFINDVVAAKTNPIVTYQYKYGDRIETIKCKQSLSYNEKYIFVRRIWNGYISVDTNGDRDYRPYLLNLLIRFLTVQLYCVNLHIPVDADITQYENFLINTDFYEEVLHHINIEDYKMLLNSTYEYINKRCDANITAVKSSVDIAIEQIVDKLTDVINMVSSKIKDIDESALHELLSDWLPTGGVENNGGKIE